MKGPLICKALIARPFFIRNPTLDHVWQDGFMGDPAAQAGEGWVCLSGARASAVYLICSGEDWNPGSEERLLIACPSVWAVSLLPGLCTPALLSTQTARQEAHILGLMRSHSKYKLCHSLLGPRTGKGTKWLGLSPSLLLWLGFVLATSFSLRK